uniref:Putative secreted protein n=1 Tax=Anopheles triannulatus TaxID=58253 RepID=A0A2M4B4V3_9DIPT
MGNCVLTFRWWFSLCYRFVTYHPVQCRSPLLEIPRKNHTCCHSRWWRPAQAALVKSFINLLSLALADCFHFVGMRGRFRKKNVQHIRCACFANIRRHTSGIPNRMPHHQHCHCQ